MLGPKTVWRQGHILCARGAEKLDPSVDNKHACFIVISHDCDLASSDDREPHFEVIRADKIDKCNGSYAHAKSPRRLHLALDAQQGYIDLHANKKRAVDRREIESLYPCPHLHCLETNEAATLRQWLALRYARSAFPDNFNLALQPYEKKLRAAIKKRSKALVAVFFDLHGDELKELPDEDVYDLSIHFVLSEESYFTQGEIASLKQTVTNVFSGNSPSPDVEAPVIELSDVFIDVESRFSLLQVRTLNRWNLEELSLRDENEPFLGSER